MVAPRFVRSRSLLLVSTASLCMDATAKRTASPVRVPLYAFASVRIVCCVRDPPSVGVSLRVFGEATEPQRRCLPGSRLFPFFSYFFFVPSKATVQTPASRLYDRPGRDNDVSTRFAYSCGRRTRLCASSNVLFFFSERSLKYLLRGGGLCALP